MRLQLKLGRIAMQSKDGTDLLGADVCQAATSSRAQVHFTIGGEKKLGFSGTHGALPELEGSPPSNPCRLRSKLGEIGQKTGAGGSWHHPARGEGPILRESTATTAAGPVCGMPSYKPQTLLLALPVSPPGK